MDFFHGLAAGEGWACKPQNRANKMTAFSLRHIFLLSLRH